MSLDLARLDEDVLAFLAERHLATLSQTRRDGSLHVVPVGFSYEPETRLARVITGGGSVKARLADRPGGQAALCQVDRARWLTLSGPVRVEHDPGWVADAERRYTERYRPPRENPERVVLVVEVTRMLGRG